jgi:hypothetical protein
VTHAAAQCGYGFRILGPTAGRRRLVDAAAVLAGYAACEALAQVEREGYLSAFTFGEDFRVFLEQNGSPKGFNGDCWAPIIWWDIDHPEDLDCALREARALAAAILDRYRVLEEDDLLLFFSGAKGFHIGTLVFWDTKPCLDFNRIARRFAEQLAARAGATIDLSVYVKVQPFRAPNSRHPKTGLHKRCLSYDELMGLSAEGIRRLAQSPEPFGLPALARTCEQAEGDWQAAAAWVRQQAEAKAQFRASVVGGTPTLNRLTLDFIRNGAEEGKRHRLLFSAAANLAEFNCPPALAHALLTDAALDCGLSPADVRRQIDCGLNHFANQRDRNGNE